MQLYVADYLGDTRHLTTEQHGAYLLLLMSMWRADGRLPNDDKKLSRIAGCTPSRWARIKGDVLAFFETDGDSLANKRLGLELEKASEKSSKRAVSGSRGGRAKALKNNKTDVANATRLPKHSSEPDTREEIEPSGSIDHSSTKRTNSKARRKGDFEKFWSEYPLKVGKLKAEKAYASALGKCETDDPEAEILEGLRRCKPLWEPDFIPHATTWLNRGGWLDQLVPENATGPPERLDLAKFDEERARMAAQYERESAA